MHKIKGTLKMWFWDRHVQLFYSTLWYTPIFVYHRICCFYVMSLRICFHSQLLQILPEWWLLLVCYWGRTLAYNEQCRWYLNLLKRKMTIVLVQWCMTYWLTDWFVWLAMAIQQIYVGHTLSNLKSP